MIQTETDLTETILNERKSVVVITDGTRRYGIPRLYWLTARSIMSDMIDMLLKNNIHDFIYRGVYYSDYILIQQLLRYRTSKPNCSIKIWVCGYNEKDLRYKHYGLSADLADHSLILYPEKGMKYSLENYLSSVASNCEWVVSFFHSSNANTSLVSSFCNEHKTKTYDIVLDEKMKPSIHRFYDTFHVTGV